MFTHNKCFWIKPFHRESLPNTSRSCPLCKQRLEILYATIYHFVFAFEHFLNPKRTNILCQTHHTYTHLNAMDKLAAIVKIVYSNQMQYTIYTRRRWRHAKQSQRTSLFAEAKFNFTLRRSKRTEQMLNFIYIQTPPIANLWNRERLTSHEMTFAKNIYPDGFGVAFCGRIRLALQFLAQLQDGE